MKQIHNYRQSELELQLKLEIEKCRELDGKLGVERLRKARVEVVNSLVEVCEQLGYDVSDLMVD